MLYYICLGLTMRCMDVIRDILLIANSLFHHQFILELAIKIFDLTIKIIFVKKIATNFHNGIFLVDDQDILLGKPRRNNSEETYITCEYLLGTLSLARKCQEQIVQIVNCDSILYWQTQNQIDSIRKNFRAITVPPIRSLA